MKNDRHLNHPAHKTTCQNRPISWPFSSSFSNGKEKDWESGFHYYGARYYWAELLTGWLSVDPMSDKYPSMSPYNYCAWNPVLLVDPDGNESIDNDDWYKDEKGRPKWDPSVTNETTLKEGEEYLGKTVLLTNNEGRTFYGDEQGRLHTSIPLAEVNITAEAAITKTDANVGIPVTVPIPISDYLWKQLSTAAKAVFEVATPIAWIIPACMLLSGDSSPSQRINGKNERHGDGARAKAKSDKQIEELERQLQNAPKKERKKIENKIKNIKRDADKKKRGEEHSRVNKR